MHVVRNATLTFILSIAAATGIIVFLSSKYAPKALSIHSELTHCQNVEDGYIGVDTAPAQLVGQNGIAETDMRPGGKVVVNGETFDAISLKGFIEAGTEITVKRYENAQLYVTQRLS